MCDDDHISIKDLLTTIINQKNEHELEIIYQTNHLPSIMFISLDFIQDRNKFKKKRILSNKINSI